MSFCIRHQVSHRGPTGGPTNFTFFSKLPPDLQEKIWVAAVTNEPRRIITVDIDSSCLKHPPEIIDEDGREYPEIDQRGFILSAKTSQNSALLHSCRKSRSEVLKVYTRAFEDTFKNPVFIDFRKDMLLFKSSYAMTQIRWDKGGCDLARVGAIAVQAASSSPLDMFPDQSTLCHVFKGFKNIMLAVLIDPRPDWKTFVATGRIVGFSNQQELQNYLFPLAARDEMDQSIPYLTLMTMDKFLEWFRGD